MSAPLVLAPISRRRRIVDRVLRSSLLGATLVSLVPLALVLFYLIKRGAPAWNADFFTTDPTGGFLGPAGGVKSAIVGSLEIVGLATAMAVPVGIGVALYLVEFGGGRRFASAVRYFIDVMTGVPSILMGLFVYIVLVLGTGGGFAGWKGSVALALLMLPIVARSSEVVLLTVPSSLREAALALGAPRWKVVARVVLPTALPGLVTGSLLALARGAGETAPLLFTSTIVAETTTNLGGRMNSLTIQIFNDIGQPRDEIVQRAWGAALLLVAMILVVTLLARLVSRRSAL